MRMVIKVRLEDSVGDSVPIRLVEFECADGELKQLGLSLADGKSLGYDAQRALVNAQAHDFLVASGDCRQCGAALSTKAKHTIRYRTVFGKMTIDSPQLRVCKCSQDTQKVIQPACRRATISEQGAAQDQKITIVSDGASKL
jgi:hypothetical protein